MLISSTTAAQAMRMVPRALAGDPVAIAALSLLGVVVAVKAIADRK